MRSDLGQRQSTGPRRSRTLADPFRVRSEDVQIRAKLLLKLPWRARPGARSACAHTRSSDYRAASRFQASGPTPREITSPVSRPEAISITCSSAFVSAPPGTITTARYRPSSEITRPMIAFLPLLWFAAVSVIFSGSTSSLSCPFRPLRRYSLEPLLGGETLRNVVKISRQPLRRDGRDRLIEFPNARQQLRAARNARQHGARVIVLPRKPRLHFRVLEILHVAIRIDHLSPEIVVGDRPDGCPGLRRRRRRGLRPNNGNSGKQNRE